MSDSNSPASAPAPESDSGDDGKYGITEAPTTFGGIVRRLGPGLIIAGSIVGSGELIATTKTGAQAGMTLLWLIILGCLIKVFVQIELGRYSITHGETTLIALNRVPGRLGGVNFIVWGWLAMMCCTVGQLGGIVGGVGQALALSVPITGDFIDADRVPSEKEINRYLSRDPWLLSEWDLRLDREWKSAAAASNRQSLKPHEAAWLQGSIDRTDAMLSKLGDSRPRLTAQLEKLIELEQGLPSVSAWGTAVAPDYRAARSELEALLVEVNGTLLDAFDAEVEANATLSNFKKFTPEQRVRLFRGQQILSEQLADLDRDRRRALVAVAAVAEKSRRAAAVKALTSPPHTLEHQAALEFLKEAEAWVKSAVSPGTRDDKIWAGVATLLTIALLCFGRYNMLQNVSIVLVVAFTFITIGNVFALQGTEQWHISWDQFVHGISFHLPETVPGETNALITALATFGIIGVGATELITYPYWCLEKGYARFTGPRTSEDAWAYRAKRWMRVMLYDAFLSMVVYTVATLAFYMMGAAVLYSEGRDPEGMRMVSTLASAYVPVFGEYAGWLFLLGAIAVLYSTFLVANAGNARMYTDGAKVFGVIDKDNPRTHNRALLFFSAVIPLVSFSLYYAGLNPVMLVLISGVAQGLMLPMIGIGSLYFRYRMTDERLKPSRAWDVMLLVSCGGLLVVGGWEVFRFFNR